jgi:hypothetical protein
MLLFIFKKVVKQQRFPGCDDDEAVRNLSYGHVVSDARQPTQHSAVCPEAETPPTGHEKENLYVHF